MNRKTLMTAVSLLVICSYLFSADWPSFQGDAEASSVSTDQVKLPLDNAWVFTPYAGPSPAWEEPGKELHRSEFDYTFYPVIGEDTVFFGSSTDDTVRAINVKNGELKWHFITGGPIRFAPVYSRGRLFAASDDGYLYCIKTEDGSLIWKLMIAPNERQQLGNGRMISRWPLRSGVRMVGENMYVTAGMWPAEGIYVYALDALKGEKKWTNDSSGCMYLDLPHPGASGFSGVAPQGHMLVVEDSVLVPTGRSIPGVYHKYTGELRHFNPGSSKHDGSSWITTSPGLYYNEAHGGGTEEAGIGAEVKPGANDGLLAYDILTGKIAFKIPRKHRIVVKDEIGYASGAGFLTAYDINSLKNGKTAAASEKWESELGRTYSLAMGGTVILAGGEGVLSAFDSVTGKRLWKTDINGQVRGIAISGDNVVISTDKGEIRCFIHSSIFMPANRSKEVVSWEGIQTSRYSNEMEDIIKTTGIRAGYALVMGENDSSRALALAMQTDLHVICGLTDASAVQIERKKLLKTGLYGSRIAVTELKTGGKLPFAAYFADLILIGKETELFKAGELYRILRPCGGILSAYETGAESFKAFCSKEGIPEHEISGNSGKMYVMRGALPGSGDWRYQWADTGNTGIGNETRVNLPLELLWYGGPGPDRMLSRHQGSSAPLCVNGKIFITGEHHLISMDAYNGRVIWERELPGAARRGSPWKSGNFIADEANLYVVTEDVCHRISQSGGKNIGVYPLPPFPDETVVTEKKEVQPSVAVQWPNEWMVFGPFAKNLPIAEAEALKAIPEELSIGDSSYKGRKLKSVNMGTDFTYIYGGFGFKTLAEGEEPTLFPRGGEVKDMETERKTCYAFAEITIEEEGELLIGAGADWWMRWFVDGKQVYDTIDKGGNRRKPYSPSNHTFRVPVTKGKHIVAAAVRAGSQGWLMVSAAGRELEERLNARPAPPKPKRNWGYIAAADGLIIGTSISSTSVWQNESTHLFAIDRETGSTVWNVKAEYGISNSGIGIAGGRLFLIDATPDYEVWQARRTGKKIEQFQKLRALDIKTGETIWTQDDVPAGRYNIICTDDVVAVGSGAVYKTSDGEKIWEKNIRSDRKTLLSKKWLFAHPNAYDVLTGEPRMDTDPLTGEAAKWEYVRAYGCGSVAGCETMLFFRSGVIGFLDLVTGGTTNFGAVRPGCSVNILPAAGLVVVPEGSSGCSCSYNFQTSLAFLPVEKTNRTPWFVFSGTPLSKPAKNIRLNFGAPGDRYDSDGQAWLGYPHPAVKNAAPVPVITKFPGAKWFNTPAVPGKHADAEIPWIHDSGIQGAGMIALFPVPAPPVPAAPINKAPQVDGKLTDACWSSAEKGEFEFEGYRDFPDAEFKMCRTEDSLFVSVSRKTAGNTAFKAEKSEPDSPVWEDDSVELVFSDASSGMWVYLAVSCSGARYDHIQKPGTRAPDRNWNGSWTSSSSIEANVWIAEIQIPFEMLKTAGVDIDNLRMNAALVNASGKGEKKIFLTDPGNWGMQAPSFLLPLTEKAVIPEEVEYEVRVYINLPEYSEENRPSTLVKIYGSKDMKKYNVTPTEETSGTTVLNIRDVAASKVIVIEVDQDEVGNPVPVLNGIEVLRMNP